ncbi:MAG: hypothetical protein ACK5L6_01165 [Anaerorhabdus sp.]|uniref:hypothetical protein n=1 Tax=Anaerorhabdus sp. TaxID=1872524 RepID=UPI003A85CF06
MRKLNIDDVLNAIALSDKFDMVKVIYSLNFEDKEDIEKIGFNAVLALLRQATTEDMRVELFTFLSAPLEMSVEEIRKLSLPNLVKLILQVADIEEWKEVFTHPLDLK